MANTDEDKKKKFEELMFKKRWSDFLKKCPITSNLHKNIGKAPACNTKGPKKEIIVAVDNKKKKK